MMAFALVFLVTYALLAKTKILGSNSFIHFLTSFLVAVIFASSPTTTQFTVLTIPWIGVLSVMLLLVLMIFAFVKGNLDEVVKSPIVSVILIAIILIIFLVAAVNVFGPFFASQMPGPEQKPGIISFLIHPAVLGGIILLIIAAISSAILTKK